MPASTSTKCYVGPGSRFANPYAGLPSEQALAAFPSWLAQQQTLLRLIRSELPSKRLYAHAGYDNRHIALLSAIANGEWDHLIQPEPIFVFGSNLAGRSGKSAAKFACDHRGAEYGVGHGPTGQAYALPTKGERLEKLPLADVLGYLDQFFTHATSTPDLSYQLTRIGCGLAAQGEAHEAAIRDHVTANAPGNVILPGIWMQYRVPTVARIIVAGSRHFEHEAQAFGDLDHLLSGLAARGADIEIVSGGARGADTIGEQYAVARGYRLRRLPAEWERYGKKQAGFIRNQLMSWYGTHLVAFWDGQSRGTGSMIRLAEGDGIATRTVDIPVAT